MLGFLIFAIILLASVIAYAVSLIGLIRSGAYFSWRAPPSGVPNA